jgi:hypothetical protein
MPGGPDVAKPAGELHLGVWRAGEQFPVLAKVAHQFLCCDAAWTQPASARLKSEHRQDGARVRHCAHTSCVLFALIVGEVVKAAAIENQAEGLADVELLEGADVSLHPVDLDPARPRASSRFAQGLPNTIDSGDGEALLRQIHRVAAGATAEIECPPRRREEPPLRDALQLLRGLLVLPRRDAEPVEDVVGLSHQPAVSRKRRTEDYDRLWRAEEDPDTKECPECTSAIPVKARRCPLCTAQIATVGAGWL